MKTRFTFCLLLVGCIGFSQDYQPCGTVNAMQANEEKHPGYLNAVNEVFQRAKQHQSQDRSVVYTIPVVVHIVYNTAQENLHDSVIFNQIERLNEDFRRLNADASNTRDTFNTIVGDSFIEFKLAQFDPNGNPTTGITRTYTTQTSFLGVGTLPADGVKSSSSGGVDPWDQSRYLNIWVCDMSLFGIPFVLGYATPPSGLPHWPPGSTDGLGDGVVIQYEAFGSNNPNTLNLGGGPIEVLGRTTVHEVGHYLGLRHIWGDGDCSEEDGVDDTPNAIDQSNQNCDFTKNTCLDDIGVLGDLPDMVENYMDYSAESCQNAFTLGQIDIMRGVLEVERYDLVNNNPAVGIFDEKQITSTVFPNPSNGTVTVSGLDGTYTTLFLYNETGQLIKQIETNSTTFQFLELNSGIYFLSIVTPQHVEVKKIVVVN